MVMRAMYGYYDEFEITETARSIASVTCSFRYNRFRIRIAGQPIRA